MALGVARGERVVLWATNVPEWVVLQFAVAKIGAILVTANTSLRARDVDYLLRQSEAATLITIRGFRDVDYVSELAAIGATAGTIPGLERLIFMSGRSADGATADVATARRVHAVRRAPRRRRRGSPRRSSTRAAPAIGPDDVINMQYTSGTTGFPKGVMLSSRNIVNNGEALGRGARLHAGRSPVPVRAAVSLLRLRHRRARRLHARRLPVSGGRVRPEAGARDRPPRALHRALRRADDVHRRARVSGLRAATT